MLPACVQHSSNRFSHTLLSSAAFKFNLRPYSQVLRAKAELSRHAKALRVNLREAGGLLRTSTRPTLNLLLPSSLYSARLCEHSA